MNRRERVAYAVAGAGATLLAATATLAAITAWNAAWRWLYTGRTK